MIAVKASETVAAGGVGRVDQPRVMELWAGCGYAVDNLLSMTYPRHVHNGMGLIHAVHATHKSNSGNHKDDSKPGRFMTMRQVFRVSAHEIINKQVLSLVKQFNEEWKWLLLFSM